MSKTYGKATDLITFSRASTATYLGPTGLIETAAANEPRVEYDASGNVLGLLVEESRTNLWAESEPNAAWFASKGGAYADLTGEDFGVITADGIHYNTTGVTTYLYETLTLTGDHTMSVIVKTDDGLQPSFGSSSFASSGNSFVFVLESSPIDPLTYSVTNLGDGVYRVSATRTCIGTAGGNAGIVKYSGNNSQTFKVTGYQLESGAFPTSYIPTSGATATRSADVASIATADFGYNAVEGTVVVEAATLIPLGSRANDGVFSLEVDDNDLHRAYLPSSNAINWQMKVGGSSIFAGAIVNTAQKDQFYKLATSWKPGDQSGTGDGTAVTSFGTNAALPAAATTLKIGYINVTDQLNGHIKSIRYYPRKLTNAQLQELTS